MLQVSRMGKGREREGCCLASSRGGLKKRGCSWGQIWGSRPVGRDRGSSGRTGKGIFGHPTWKQTCQGDLETASVSRLFGFRPLVSCRK